MDGKKLPKSRNDERWKFLLILVTKLNCALLHVASHRAVRGIRVVTNFLTNNEMLFATFA